MIAAGPRANRTELLLKFVVAIAGDDVYVTLADATVSSYVLDITLLAARGRSLRKLITLPGEALHLSAGQLGSTLPMAGNGTLVIGDPSPQDEIERLCCSRIEKRNS